jgi:hypothetical protein
VKPEREAFSSKEYFFFTEAEGDDFTYQPGKALNIYDR